MKTPFIALVALIGCLSLADAQKQKPREPLETGFERKLGVVYKTVGHNWRRADAATAIELSRDEIFRATVEFFRDHVESLK